MGRRFLLFFGPRPFSRLSGIKWHGFISRIAETGVLIRPLLLLFIAGLWGFPAGCGRPSAAPKIREDAAPRPPMGWNAWNTFGDRADADLLRQVADALVTTGMRDAGYRYVNLDDGWALPERVDGHLSPDPVKFPGGFKPLSDYLHARGLKFGIYADRGTRTCVKGSPGSYGHETTDARDFASWGVDYVKYDNCHPALFSSQEADDRRMARALAATGRPMVFSICDWRFRPWMAKTGNLWRTAGDITDQWDNIVRIIDVNERSAPYAGPGRWNDPDMLVVGCYGVADLQHGRGFGGASEWAGRPGLTEVEQKSHFSMWAVMAAPLLAGNDIRRMPRGVRDILLNREVIAVDQDPLGRQGVEVWTDGAGLGVYSKPLEGKDVRAVALFNRTERNEDITVRWKDIGISAGPAKVRDLWRHADLGVFSGGYRAYVPPHGVVLLKVSASVPG
jgi:alpha-galactosidase